MVIRMNISLPRQCRIENSKGGNAVPQGAGSAVGRTGLHDDNGHMPRSKCASIRSRGPDIVKRLLKMSLFHPKILEGTPASQTQKRPSGQSLKNVVVRAMDSDENWRTGHGRSNSALRPQTPSASYEGALLRQRLEMIFLILATCYGRRVLLSINTVTEAAIKWYFRVHTYEYEVMLTFWPGWPWMTSGHREDPCPPPASSSGSVEM